MHPGEARVLIVEDDIIKAERLTATVEDNGGSVVGHAETLDVALDIVGSSGFPADAGNPNVVLIDGDLTPKGEHGADGADVFQEGYVKGVLRRADLREGLGVLAAGCSSDDDAEVVRSTGANFVLQGDDTDSQRWAGLLAGHPENPEVALPGTISRYPWPSFQLKDILGEVIPGVDTVTVLSLTVTEQLQREDAEPVEYPIEDTAVIGQEASADTLAASMKEIKSEMPRDRDSMLHSHSALAVIKTDTDLIIIDHGWKRNMNVQVPGDPNFLFDGKTDIIPLDKVADIPASYWQESLGSIPAV